MRLRASLVLVFAALPIAAAARLGDSLDQLRHTYGRSISDTERSVVWLIESPEGALTLAVTLDGSKHSIAEGLKPFGRAILTHQVAEAFIGGQLERSSGSKTRRTLKPGESCEFGGQRFTCGADEVVIVDVDNDVLIVWSRAAAGTVMAVRRAMIDKTAK